jgi:MoaA/NifB/PqqE/SkfB family radical SAM enzyme
MPDKELYYSASPHFSQCYYIMTSRGCQYSCSFCCHSYLKKLYKDKGRYVRSRSVKHVIEELAIIKQRHGARMVRFHDDDMLLHDIGWLEEFADQYSKKIGLPFACFIHPNTVTARKAELLKIAGCHDVEIGIQSIRESTNIEVFKRNVSVSQLEQSMRILKQCGLNIITDNIVGAPYQGIDEIVDLIKFHNKNRVMKIYCFGFRHYPKTEIIKSSRDYFNLSAKDIQNLEEGVNVQAFVSGGDNLSLSIRQLQTFFAFLLYLPKSFNNFIIERRLFRFFPPLPYFLTIIFSNWLRIPYKYNWSLHISLVRYGNLISRRLRSIFLFQNI